MYAEPISQELLENISYLHPDLKRRTIELQTKYGWDIEEAKRVWAIENGNILIGPPPRNSIMRFRLIFRV
jgi:hypothetical protein